MITLKQLCQKYPDAEFGFVLTEDGYVSSLSWNAGLEGSQCELQDYLISNNYRLVNRRGCVIEFRTMDNGYF